MNKENKWVFTWYYPQRVVMRFFVENHAGKFTVLLPKEIHLDEEFDLGNDSSRVILA